MSKIKYITVIGPCLLVSVIGLVTIGQKKPQRASKLPDQNLELAQAITEDLVKDAKALGLSDRTLLWMRLGETWVNVDRERANTWLKKAVIELEFAPNEETVAERHQRLAIARDLLKVLAPLDKELSARLTAVFVEGSTSAADVDSGENAIALANAAKALIDVDPKRAAELASVAAFSLRVGNVSPDLSSVLMIVVVKLRKHDRRLADGLFNNMLAIARSTSDKQLFVSLIWSAFKAPQELNCDECALPDDLRKSLLLTLIQSLQQSQSAGKNDADCNFLFEVAPPLLYEYDRLVPEQATIVRQELNKCQARRQTAEQPATQDLGKPGDIDEMVSAADKIVNPILRAATLIQVASKAAGQGKFDRAIEILYIIGSDMPLFVQAAWRERRIEWAVLSALDHLKKGDRNGEEIVFNAIPITLRLDADFLLAERLDENKDRMLAKELLLDGLKYLARDDIDTERKATWYPSAVRLMAKYIPTQASGVLNDAVRVLNRLETSPSTKATPTDLPVWSLWYPLDLAGPLLEIDELGVLYSVAGIKSPLFRVRVRLGLLASSLERVRIAH